MCLLYYVAILILSTHLVSGEEDCVTGDEWGLWCTCSHTGVDVLEEQGVGKQTRERAKVGGMHCQRRDLVETKLCDLLASGSSGNNDSGAGGGVLPHRDDTDSDRHEEDAEHETEDRTERTIFITLLSVTTLLLTTGTVIGLLLVRQHKVLQRRHKILVMTRERVRLIDGEKLEVKRSGNILLCGVGSPHLTLCGVGSPHLTLHNPGYESEEEWAIESGDLPTGKLELSSQ